MSKWSSPPEWIKKFNSGDQCWTWNALSWKSCCGTTNCDVAMAEREKFPWLKRVCSDDLTLWNIVSVILSTPSDILQSKKWEHTATVCLRFCHLIREKKDARISSNQCIRIWRQFSYNSKFTSSCRSQSLIHETPFYQRKNYISREPIRWVDTVSVLGLNGLRRRQWDRFEITLRFFWATRYLIVGLDDIKLLPQTLLGP